MASVDVIKVISSVKPRAFSIINHKLDVGRHPSDAKVSALGVFLASKLRLTEVELD
jgi:hypothetical protein